MVQTREDRFVGCLVGLAVGDALGTTLEFTHLGQFTPIADMVGGGPFDLEPGQWTDDTSMALCLADSLIACDGFDAADQMRRYLRWWREGHRSSRPGDCFDIGNTTRRALWAFERTGDPFSGIADSTTAGNGSLMRLAPVPMFFADDPPAAVRYAAESSRTTHGADDAISACRYWAALVVGALRGASKEELLSPRYAPPGVAWQPGDLAPKVRSIADGAYRRKEAHGIDASGYVVHTMQAALWAFDQASTFADGALLAVNLGGDADTTGAVYGQLAGAFYGRDGIPAHWRDRLYDRDEIERLAVALIGRT